MADFYNPQFASIQTQMQQLQNILGQKPAASAQMPSAQTNNIWEVDGEEGARLYQKTMSPNSKAAVFDKNEQVFFAMAVDAKGVLQPIYRCPYTMEPLPEPGSNTITKQDFDAFEAKIMGLIASMAPKKTPAKKEAEE